MMELFMILRTGALLLVVMGEYIVYYKAQIIIPSLVICSWLHYCICRSTLYPGSDGSRTTWENRI